MLYLRQGKRQYRLASVGENHATLLAAGAVKPGPATVQFANTVWTVDVTARDGLTVAFSRRPRGRPKLPWNADIAAQVAALRAGGLTEGEIAKRVGMCRDTLWRKTRGKRKASAAAR